MTRKSKDILCAALFIAFGIFIFIQALAIKPIMGKDLGSGFMPKVVAVAIIAAAVAKLAFIMVNKDEAYCNKKLATKGITESMGGLLTIAALAGYVALFDVLGFVIATGLYLFVQILVLSGKEHRNIPATLAISIIAPIAVYVLFVYAISMPLPTGILNF